MAFELTKVNKKLARLELVKKRAAFRTKQRFEQIQEEQRIKEMELAMANGEELEDEAAPTPKTKK